MERAVLGKEITAAELREVQLSMLSRVAAYCEERGIGYMLCAGTLLGAVRHKGFIPWDDDIDLAMPRQDYERFLEGFSLEPYLVVNHQNEPSYPYPFAKVIDTRTVLIEDANYDLPLGVYLDIFPIDGLPDDEQAQAKLFRKMRMFRRLHTIKTVPKGFKIDIIHKIYHTVMKGILAPLPLSRVPGWMTTCASRYPVTETGTAASLCWMRGTTEMMPGRVFLETIKGIFEDREYSIPKDYDLYLTRIYGNYMEYPPVEKRVSHHMFTAYWKKLSD